MKRTWFFHNAVAHPAMALLDAAGRALLVASAVCRRLAERVHDETCPRHHGHVDDDITSDDIAEAVAWPAGGEHGS